VRNERVVEEELLDLLRKVPPRGGTVQPVRRVPNPSQEGDPIESFLRGGIDWIEAEGGAQPVSGADSTAARLARIAEQRSRLAARVASLQGEADRRERALRSRIATLRERVAELEAQVSTLREPEESAPATSVPECSQPEPRRAKSTGRCSDLQLHRHLVPQGEGRSPTWSLLGDRSYVGRGIEADIRLEHPTVSRLHCVLYCVGGALVVEDARSLHGVYVNGRRVQQAVLKDGDVVAFGDVAFSLRVLRPSDATAR